MNGAFYATVDKVVPIQGANKIQIAIVKGEQCIVSKEVSEGDKGILFPAGLQLSEEFASHNNLFRKAEKNKDQSKRGFFEDSRRVRTQPFLGVKSEAFFIGVESVNYISKSKEALETKLNGDAFQELAGVKICEKYYSQATLNAMANSKNKAGVSKPQTPYFKEHMDTKHLRHYLGLIPEGSIVYIQNKRHGTSFRVSHTLVKTHSTGWKAKVKSWLGIPTTKEEWKHVCGTRRVVLHNSPHKQGFHGSEQFRYDVMDKLKPFMPKGMTIYGEIVGFVNGKPIMSPHSTKSLKDAEFTQRFGETITYNYGCAEGQNKFHIYRITQLGVDGVERDFSQEQIDSWCRRHGFETTTTFEKIIYDSLLEDYLKARVDFWQDVNCADVDSGFSHPSEGLIIRVDHGEDAPTFYKEKAYWFKVMEGHCEAVDQEDAS